MARLRVRYAETDQMGVAYHGSYLAWFEIGRTELLREAGLTYRELEAQGVRLPVTEVDARYRRPARYDDELEVRTRLVALTGARARFAYEVVRAQDQELLATGSTSHAALDERGRPCRLPKILRRCLI